MLHVQEGPHSRRAMPRLSQLELAALGWMHALHCCTLLSSIGRAEGILSSIFKHFSCLS